MTAARRLPSRSGPRRADHPADAADLAAVSRAAADDAESGKQMIEPSTSRMHVAILLDRLHAADHHQIVGNWPSLLIVTSNASLQLDPAPGLTRAQATLISSRMLYQVARWDEAIRRCNSTAVDQRIDLMEAVEGI